MFALATATPFIGTAIAALYVNQPDLALKARVKPERGREPTE
jgi:hypothetical protein